MKKEEEEEQDEVKLVLDGCATKSEELGK